MGEALRFPDADATSGLSLKHACFNTRKKSESSIGQRASSSGSLKYSENYFLGVIDSRCLETGSSIAFTSRRSFSLRSDKQLFRLQSMSGAIHHNATAILYNGFRLTDLQGLKRAQAHSTEAIQTNGNEH